MEPAKYLVKLAATEGQVGMVAAPPRCPWGDQHRVLRGLMARIFCSSVPMVADFAGRILKCQLWLYGAERLHWYEGLKNRDKAPCGCRRSRASRLNLQHGTCSGYISRRRQEGKMKTKLGPGLPVSLTESRVALFGQTVSICKALCCQ